MTFELGRAQFILDADGTEALASQAKVYNEVTKNAQKLTKELAKELKVRQSDIKNAASVIIAEEKKLATEQAKILKERAALEAKATKERLDRLKQDVANEVRAYKAQEQETKRRIEYVKTLDKQRDDAAKKEITRIQQQLNAEKKAQDERERIARRNTRSGSGRDATGGNALGVLRGVPGDIATIAGFGAIASGAILIRQALITLIDATRQQEQAQRALNAAFGASTPIFKQNAEDLAKQFNLVSSEVAQATARFGVLQNQTQLTGEQIKKLNEVAINNQAAFGGDLLEAHRALAGAILGETEAYEKYGVVLQEGVLKSSSKLTEDERRRFTTMSESEKQMIRYRIILEEAVKVQGAAAQKAKETQGAFDLLNRSVNELAKTVGPDLVGILAASSRELGGVIGQLNNFVIAIKAIRDAQNELGGFETKDIFNTNFIGNLGIRAGAFIANQQKVEEEIARKRDIDRRLEEQKQATARAEQLEKDAEKARIARRDREEAELKVQRERIEAGLRYAHDQEIKRINDRKKELEAQQEFELRALDARRDAELRRLKDVDDARRQAYEDERDRITAERDEAIKAIEERKRAELAALDAAENALEAVAEEQIRNLEIDQERRQRANDAQRRQDLQQLEREQEERKRQRIIEDREIKKRLEDQDRQLEDNHRKQLRRIELEGEKLRQKAEGEKDRIEERERKEANRHRKELDRIDDEKDQAIEAIDEQLKAFERAQRARQNARQRAEQQERVTEAQLDVRRATGSQDAAAREAAQAKLVGALRIGDPTAIKKAQDELIEIVGQGNLAIEEANKKLNKAQEDLRDHDIDAAEDAQREKLELEKDRIDKEREAERRQEEDRNRRRVDRLRKDKDAEDDRLQDALRKLERRQEKEDDEFRKAKRRQDDLTKNQREQLEDRRQNEDEAHERSVEKAEERHRAEQELIKDTFTSEERGYIPAVRRALRATKDTYGAQKTEIENRYRGERDQIEETYNHPTKGIFVQLERQETENRLAHERMVEDVRKNAEKQRKAVQDSYRHPDGKSGMIDQLDTLKEETDQKLKDILLAFDQHAKGLTAPGGIIQVQWAVAEHQAKQYFDYVKNRMEALEKELEADRRRRQQILDSDAPSNRPQQIHSGNRDGGGMGTQPIPPATRNSTGSADPESTGTSPVDPDTIDDEFSTSFGYLQPYNGRYEPRPGWEGRAAWPGGPSHHKGVDLILPGPNNGRGRPIPAFHGGRVLRTVADSRGPGGLMVVIEDNVGRTHWYLHLDGYSVAAGDTVKRGDIIGRLGGTGTEEFPHLHYEVRAGDNDGPATLEALRRNGIDPMPFVRGRDAGYRFTNPTVYQDLRTGERGVLAEQGPELLLGRQATQQFESMGLTRALNRPATMTPDYVAIGASMAQQPTVMYNNTRGGDNFTYYGVAPESVIERWRSDQRRRNVLRGIGGLVK
jgi:murein DD-endopeptidase MepM/ murein hydrolase activator NlpD